MKLIIPFSLLTIMLFSLSGIAQASAEVPAFVGEVVLPFLFEKVPFLGYVFLIVGGFRLLVKPIMEALEDFFGYVSYDRGSRKIHAIKESKVYYWFSFVIDYLFSIKLKK